LTEQIKCKHEPGIYIPVINRNRCEGKAECVAVCPVGVFNVGTLPKALRSKLSLRGKLKGFAHKWQQAILVNAECCEACGLCLKACPEDAITLKNV
jgi:NAD-dependent dihydropyrimidine dehydrogenase PreA subunit